MHPIEHMPALCEPLPKLVTAVGSRVTCNPPPTDTDADFLVLVDESDFAQYERNLFKYGFGSDGSRPDNETQMGGNFWSYSMDHEGTRVNLIVTRDFDWHGKFILATNTAKALNLLSKQDRITLFQAILYGNHPKQDDSANHRERKG